MDAPVCDCHGVPMLWNRNSNTSRGGFWRCRVKANEASRRYRRQHGTSEWGSPEHRAKIARKHHGSFVSGYWYMHERAKAVLPHVCAHCGTTEGRLECALRHDGSPRARQREKRGARRLSFSLLARDYVRLCARCHAEYDGRAALHR